MSAEDDEYADEYADVSPEGFRGADLHTLGAPAADANYFDGDGGGGVASGDGGLGGGGEYLDEGGDHFDDEGFDTAPATREVTYDFPGAAPATPRPEDACGHSMASTASPGLDSSGLPEEIDVNTTGLIEETTQRLTFIHGVLGVLIIDRDGLIVHATMPIEEAARLAGPTLQLLQRARAVAALTPDDELRMLCVRTRKYELLLCSEADGAFAICTIQDVAPEQQHQQRTGEEGGLSAASRSVLRAAHTSVF